MIKYLIREGAKVGQDFCYFHWPEEYANVKFDIVERYPKTRNNELYKTKLTAPGFGRLDLPNGYGSGAVYANDFDLIPVENEEGEMECAKEPIDRFWIVWNGLPAISNFPTRKHESYEEAFKEAERLSDKHPGHAFYILVVVSGVQAKTVREKLLVNCG